jgi:SAM-dependent methyltransferase
MRTFDIILQRWRSRIAQPWVPAGANVLDIGCLQGEFLSCLGDRIRSGIGLDPSAQPYETPRYRVLSERFQEPAPFPDASFDAVVMLATLEHILDKEPLARECHRLLRPGGRVIVTVPSPTVDIIMAALIRCRIADGTALDEHHGFMPQAVVPLFRDRGFVLEKWRRFQLGLNHLFVFRKPGADSLVRGSRSPARGPHARTTRFVTKSAVERLGLALLGSCFSRYYQHG